MCCADAYRCYFKSGKKLPKRYRNYDRVDWGHVRQNIFPVGQDVRRAL